MNYLSEAFKKLDFLTEEEFSLQDTAGLDDMDQLLKTPASNIANVIDPEAETEDELQDTYIGKVILHCPVCNSMIYKDMEDIVKDDVEELVNIGEECPYCYTSEGFKVIGIVSPFEETSEEEEQEDEEDPAEEENELTEEFEKVEVATENQKVTLDADDDGKLTIEAEPVEEDEEDEEEEVLAPVPDEVADDIEATANNSEDEDEDEEVEYDVEDFDSDSFDELGESYLKSVYENVRSYKTTDVSSKGNTLVVEGLIKFNSGKTKPTKFVFEANTATKNNKLRFIGENKQITRGRKAFTITGKLNENKSFITERFNYNYMTKNEKGKSTRLYGTLKK